MRRITPAAHRRVPWRNGGGTTNEILVEPGPAKSAAAGGERFLYRLSVADVESDGPFSSFDGYDRHIMLLQGQGMTLQCGAHGVIELRPLEPRAFSGDWEVSGALVAGPVQDLNLIVDRGRATSSLDLREMIAPEWLDVAADTVCLVHVLEGALDGADAGDTLVVSAGVELRPLPRARLVVGRVTLARA